MIERDPRERGFVDIVEYYDESGKLLRRESRFGNAESLPQPF
jgi:hypothetical protein